VPDFPKPGILFYDITTLLKDKAGFAQLIDALAAALHRPAGRPGPRHRGARLHLRPRPGLSPQRRLRPRAQARKLPAPTARVTYDLEYGTDSLEIHLDAIQPGQRVVLVDDLLATGGTMQATIKLVKQLGGEIAGLAFAVELDFLKGRAKFPEYDVFSLLHYDE
jgi:adenine phosphoribosyltransferase